MDDDRELVDAWHAGDNQAGRKLIARHYEAVYRFFFAKVSARACEDLTQATFEVVVRRRGDYRGEGAFRAYLYGIARNVLINHVRRAQRERERFEPGEHSLADPLSDHASQMFAEREHERIVSAALRSLPLDDQIAIELKDWEGLSQDELALLFGVPRSTIGSRLSRARARLRQAIEALTADVELRGELQEGLDTCMGSIRRKIDQHLARGGRERP